MAGAGVAKVILSFLANLALVRLLSPSDFGRFAIVQDNVSLIGAFLNFRTAPLILRAPEEELESDGLGQYSAALVAETLLVGISSIVVLSVFDLLTTGAMILLGTTLTSSWIATELKLYERKFQYKEIGTIETIARALSQVFAVVGAYFGLGALVLYFKGTVKQTIILGGLRRVGGLQPLPLRWLSLEEWKQYLGKLSGFWTDGLLARTFDRTFILLVGAIAGEQSTGFFFQARKLARTPNTLLSPVLNRVAFNYFSHHVPHQDRKTSLHRGLISFGVGLGIGAVLVYLLADPIIPWLFGNDWTQVVPILQAMSAVIVAKPLFNMVKAFYMSQNYMRPFILYGRGGQFFATALTAGILFLFDFTVVGIGLGLGLSGSYVLGGILPLIFGRTTDIKKDATNDK